MGGDLYKKILIATDGSENGAQAVSAGMEIARLSKGKAYALYVIDNTCYPAGKSDPKLKTAMEEHFKTLGLEMTAAVEKAAKATGVDVEFVIREGRPAEKTDAERFLLGSISEKVVRNAKVPVLVVHGKKP